MPDPDKQTTDDGSAGTATIEGLTQVSMEQAQEDAFGESDGEPKADPDKPESKGSEPSKAKTGEEKPGTTALTPEQEAAKKAEEESNRKYAGQFETVEALEAAVTAKQSHIGRIEADNKAKGDKVVELERKLSELSTAKPTPTKTEEEDLTKTLTDNADYKEMREVLEEQLGIDSKGADTILKGFFAVVKNSTGGKATLDPDVTAKLSRLESLEEERQFESAHPEYKDETINKTMTALIEEANLKINDRQFQMGLILDAAKGRMMPELIDKAVVLKLKRMTKQEKEKLLAGELVSGRTSEGKPAGAPSGPTMQDTQKEVFGKEDDWGD